MGAQAIRLHREDIDTALKAGQILLATQPVVCLRTNELRRRQVIARWNHPRKGILSPDVTAATFATGKQAGVLTRHVLERVLVGVQLREFGETGDLGIALSPDDVADRHLPAAIDAMVRAAGWAPENLTLECPPTADGLQDENLVAAYRRLAMVGCPLSLRTNGRLTDFFREMAPFPFSEIRADGTPFLRRLRATNGTRTERPLRDLLDFAESRDITVVAGGIDDYQTAGRTRELGFAAGQGRVLGEMCELREQANPYAARLGQTTIVEDAERVLPAVPPTAEKVLDAEILEDAPQAGARALQAKLQRDFIRLAPTDTSRSDRERPVDPADRLDAIVAQLPVLPSDHADRQTLDTKEPAAATAVPVARPRTNRRRKNPLSKKYRVTHFWPRSWRD